MRKAVGVICAVSAGIIGGHASAQPAPQADVRTCMLDAAELAKAPAGDDLLEHQSRLEIQKKDLESRLAVASKLIEETSAANRTERAVSVAAIKDKIALNLIALSQVRMALASFAKRQESVTACERALARLTLISRMALPDSVSEDRQSVLKEEAAAISSKLDAARTANGDLIQSGASALVYARISLADIGPDLPPGLSEGLQANAATPPEIRQTDPCKYMISEPLVTLKVGRCGGDARLRSARSFPGGEVAFPSSVLRPRGITANLAGSSSNGTISLNYADSFNFRRTPRTLPANPGDRVQLPWEFGYSVGVAANDGLIFTRDDPDKSIADTLDGKATFKAGLFFNVYEGETRQAWEARAAKLTDAAVNACRKDQASGESKTPSTCAGQSLTDWVFEVDGENGALLRSALAKQAGSLYFASEDDKPVWGGGVDIAISRSNFDYLNPVTFIADPMSKNLSDGGWNFASTVFAYRRLNRTSLRWDLSAIPSLSYSSRFGYAEGTKQRQFCPAVITGTPFVTAGCPSYYTTAPSRIRSWTPALEVRVLTPQFGPIPPLGISPKLSHESIDGSSSDRWLAVFPLLAFVEKEKGLGVGLEYSREWGGRSDTTNAAGTFDEIPDEDTLKIVVTKTFSLTGN